MGPVSDAFCKACKLSWRPRTGYTVVAGANVRAPRLTGNDYRLYVSQRREYCFLI